MKKINVVGMMVAAGMLSGCSDSMLDINNQRAEQYVQDFIQRYGIPAENHTFSMAQQSGVTVRCSEPTDVKVTAKVSGTEYLFADWNGVSGTQHIVFDLPVGVNQVKIHANGQVFSAKVGEVVDLNGGQKAKSRDDKSNLLQDNKGKITWLESEPFPDQININGTDEYYGALYPTKEAENQYGMDFYHNDKAENRVVSYTHTMQIYASTLLEQLVSKDKDFYTEANNFYDVNRAFVMGGPGIQISYVRKDLNLEIGMLIGNDATLASSDSIFAIPMFETKNHKNLVLRRVPGSGQIDADGNFKYKDRGASMSVYFDPDNGNASLFYGNNGNSGNVYVPSTNIQNEECFTWDFVEPEGEKLKGTHDYMFGLKKEVEKLYELYKKDPVTKKRLLPLPGDNGDQEITFNGKTLPPYEVIKKDEDGNIVYKEDGVTPEKGTTPAEEYMPAFQEYLEYCLKQLPAEQKENYYTELRGLKEWFTSRGFVFDENDIPEITPFVNSDNEIVEGAYNINFRWAKHPTGYDYLPDGYGNDQDYTTFPDDYTVYVGLFSWQTLPKKLEGNQLVYYFKDLDKGTFVTTLDGNIKERRPKTQLSFEGSPAYSKGGSPEWVLDYDATDNSYCDVVFAINAWGSSSGNGFPNYTWLLACEDLGSTGDNDYNDLVVSMAYTSTNNVDYVKIYPQAAGGTYPAYLMYNEVLTDETGAVTDTKTFFVGPEIHNWLGFEDTSEMVGTYENTLTGFTNDKGVTYQYDKFRHSNRSFTLGMNELLNNQGIGSDGKFSGDFAGFWVLVDKDGKVKEHGLGTDSHEMKLLDLESDEFKLVNSTMYQVANTHVGNINIPVMMVLGPQWEWPQETKDISKVYHNWLDWIKTEDRSSVHWYGTRDKEDSCQKQGNHFAPIDRTNVTVRQEVENLWNKLNPTEE